MNIGIDFNQLMNTELNKVLLSINTGNPEVDKVGKCLIKFANKYGFFGADAMNFITDLLRALEEVKS